MTLWVTETEQKHIGLKPEDRAKWLDKSEQGCGTVKISHFCNFCTMNPLVGLSHTTMRYSKLVSEWISKSIMQQTNANAYKKPSWRKGKRATAVRIAYSVSQKNPHWGLVAIFPKQLGIFQPNFKQLLRVPIYARLQIVIQLSATLTKLCHIKRDHPSSHHVHKMSTTGWNVRRHFLTFSPNN